jgi:hypothetical protein
MKKIVNAIFIVLIIVLIIYLLFLPIQISRKKPQEFTPIRIY